MVLLRILIRAVLRFGRHRGGTMAAALSYYGLFSLFPLLLLLALLAATVEPTPAFRRALAGLVHLYFPGSEGVVTTALQRLNPLRGQLGLAGGAGLLWAGSGVFTVLVGALDQVWERPRGESRLRRRLVGLLTLLGAVVALFLAALLSLGVGALLPGWMRASGLGALGAGAARLAGGLLPPLLVWGALLLLYRFLPSQGPPLAEVWPGSLVAALGVELLRRGFALYAARLTRLHAVYGSLATGVLLLFWIYLVAAVVLFGAEVSAAYGRWRRGQADEEAEGAGWLLRL
ncbi:MAG: YihY/virulence factor BrkB family protein [Clostridia bacterium]|nr:YihY/virulence factor BrkB family protein [Clostridia bacterium]MCL6521739.1 YihY/virulence factor BrkB family protein [Bacillota bacterium]